MRSLFNPLKITHDMFPQNTAADATARRRIADPNQTTPGVYQYYDRYQTRISIGRMQHTIATGTIHACLRMTDAALLYFWGYRARPARGPLDIDFNVGLDVARNDIESCEWLREHFEYVEHELINAGMIDPSRKRAVNSKPPEFDRAKFLLQWQAFKVESSGFLRALAKSGESAKFLHATMSEHLNAIEKCIDTADRSIIKPSTMKPDDASMEQIL